MKAASNWSMPPGRPLKRIRYALGVGDLPWPGTVHVVLEGQV